MNQYTCIKEIPTLCNIGDVGNIELTSRTTLVSNTGWYNEGIWWSSQKLCDLLEFKFKREFSEYDCEDILGKHILLSEYFRID